MVNDKMPTTTIEMRVSLMVMVFDLYNRLRITRLIGMFNNKAVIRLGAYVFIKIVEIKCGKMALKIIEPKNPINAHFKTLVL
jgi:hypothetical protein